MITREWRRPGLYYLRKRTPKKEYQTSEYTKRRCRIWGGQDGYTGDGGIREKHKANNSGPEGDWDAGRGLQRGVPGMQMVGTDKGRKGT